MKIKCDFCESYFEDTESSCPYCGGANTAVGNHRFSNGVPKTIEELKQWAEQCNVPLAEMRVYIGDNNYSPKCIGIYKEGSDVIVYKNKSDGTRAIRYQGSDEAYAVNEVYLKIKEMMAMAAAAKRAPGSNSRAASYSGEQSSPYNANGYNRPSNTSGRSVIGIIAIIIIIIAMTAMFPSCIGDIGRVVQGYSSSSYSSGSYGSGYSSGYNSNTSNWDYDYGNDSNSGWDYNYGNDSNSGWDYDWDSDWDSDYGDYDWDFDFDWDSDW